VTGETPARYVPHDRRIDDKAWLYKAYWECHHSCQTIAEMCNVCTETVREHLERFGIPRRSKTWQRQAGEYDVRDDFTTSQDEVVTDSERRTDAHDFGPAEEGTKTDWSIAADSETVVDAD